MINNIYQALENVTFAFNNINVKVRKKHQIAVIGYEDTNLKIIFKDSKIEMPAKLIGKFKVC